MTRRHLILGTGAQIGLVATERLMALGSANDVDVAIVGAGPAGIAAARMVAAAGRSYALLEAAPRVGGRTLTDTDLFGVPFDMGAHWIHMPALHPLSMLGRQAGFTLYRAPSDVRLFVGSREASKADYRAYDAAVARAEEAIWKAGRQGRDIPASEVVPKGGPWSATAALMVGPLSCGKDMSAISTLDFANSAETEVDEFCRQGLGTLVATLAAPLAVHLETQVNAIDLAPRRPILDTSRGPISAATVILAVPPPLVAEGRPRVRPALPAEHREAVERLSLGAYDHIAFMLPGNPLDLNPDELACFQSDTPDGFAILGRIGGTDLHSVEVGGRLARDLAATPGAGEAFAREVVGRACGWDAAGRLGTIHATRWTEAPFAQGAFSCAEPGAGHLRRVFATPVGERLFFAGEHTHENLWGTVGGAWLSGERAARHALAAIAGDGPAP